MKLSRKELDALWGYYNRSQTSLFDHVPASQSSTVISYDDFADLLRDIHGKEFAGSELPEDFIQQVVYSILGGDQEYGVQHNIFYERFNSYWINREALLEEFIDETNRIVPNTFERQQIFSVEPSPSTQKVQVETELQMAEQLHSEIQQGMGDELAAARREIMAERKLREAYAEEAGEARRRLETVPLWHSLQSEASEAEQRLESAIFAHSDRENAERLATVEIDELKHLVRESQDELQAERRQRLVLQEQNQSLGAEIQTLLERASRSRTQVAADQLQAERRQRTSLEEKNERLHSEIQELAAKSALSSTLIATDELQAERRERSSLEEKNARLQTEVQELSTKAALSNTQMSAELLAGSNGVGVSREQRELAEERSLVAALRAELAELQKQANGLEIENSSLWRGLALRKSICQIVSN